MLGIRDSFKKRISNLSLISSELMEYINWFILKLKQVIYVDTVENKKRIKLKRGLIYSIDFGKNIGSEFEGFHYCILLTRNSEMCTVVPLTSKRSRFGLELGRIKNLGTDDSVVSFGLLNQIKSVSIFRLSNIDLKPRLLPEQLDLLDEEIIKTFTNSKNKTA